MKAQVTASIKIEIPTGWKRLAARVRVQRGDRRLEIQDEWSLSLLPQVDGDVIIDDCYWVLVDDAFKSNAKRVLRVMSGDCVIRRENSNEG